MRQRSAVRGGGGGGRRRCGGDAGEKRSVRRVRAQARCGGVAEHARVAEREIVIQNVRAEQHRTVAVRRSGRPGARERRYGESAIASVADDRRSVVSATPAVPGARGRSGQVPWTSPDLTSMLRRTVGYCSQARARTNEMPNSSRNEPARARADLRPAATTAGHHAIGETLTSMPTLLPTPPQRHMATRIASRATGS